jgi:uncharacterized linocin/CFP29 family protein
MQMTEEIANLAAKLTNEELCEYNDIITTFNKADKGVERLGQAFYNMYYNVIFTEPYPELFYEEDNHKAREMITKCVIKYLLSKRYRK